MNTTNEKTHQPKITNHSKSYTKKYYQTQKMIELEKNSSNHDNEENE